MKPQRNAPVALWLILAAVASDRQCLSDNCEIGEESDETALLQGHMQTESGGNKFYTDPGSMLQKTGRGATAVTQTTTVSVMVEGTKLQMNAAGDLPAFLSALEFNLIISALCILGFALLQRHYPRVFLDRNIQYFKDKEDMNPKSWDSDEKTWFGWVHYALFANKTQQIEHGCGLDNAMLIQFTVYAMQLMGLIGLPAVLGFIPIFAFAGGNIAGDDRLSHVGVGNVVFNSTDNVIAPEFVPLLPKVQWIWYVLAVYVWYVVLASERLSFNWQRYFQTRRKDWLDALPEPDSTTIVVEDIPEEYCTDAKLKTFMEKTFDMKTGSTTISVVKEAFVVKNTSSRGAHAFGPKIPKLIAQYQQKDQEIHTLEYEIENKKKATQPVGEEEADLQELKTSVEAILQEIYRAQDEVAKAAVAGDPDIYTTTGFVTFTERKYREMAVALQIGADLDEWCLDEAPAQQDVIYDDLMIPDHRQKGEKVIGYALIVALFFVYMPICLYIDTAATKLSETPVVANLLNTTGMTSTAEGVLSSLGLTIMTAMLPTFLMWIFAAFFPMKSEGFRQHFLQRWYFWFLIVFVLLGAAVGKNFETFAVTLAESPFSVFSQFASLLPLTTHFFLNFVPMQLVTHSMNLTRYVSLGKFILFGKVCTEERAKQLSEPEDQDYYGIGSRSARFTLILIIGIVFGTICPLMNVLVFLNFFACRLIYGYLIVYAETRKNDGGGHNWATQLEHVQIGVLIYIVLMVGILLQRAESMVPAIIAAVSFFWWLIAYRKFTRALLWEKLPFTRMSPPATEDDEGKKIVKRRALGKKYFQPELEKDPEKWGLA